MPWLQCLELERGHACEVYLHAVQAAALYQANLESKLVSSVKENSLSKITTDTCFQ